METIEYDGLQIAVRREKVKDRMALEVLESRLLQDEDSESDKMYKRLFLRASLQSDVQGDLGFRLPTVHSSDEELASAFESFKELDAALYDRWATKLLQVDKRLNTVLEQTDQKKVQQENK